MANDENVPRKQLEKAKTTDKALPFDFSACSSERDRNSSGLFCADTVAVALPNEPPCATCCEANSSVRRFAKFIASDPHTV